VTRSSDHAWSGASGDNSPPEIQDINCIIRGSFRLPTTSVHAYRPPAPFDLPPQHNPHHQPKFGCTPKWACLTESRLVGIMMSVILVYNHVASCQWFYICNVASVQTLLESTILNDPHPMSFAMLDHLVVLSHRPPPLLPRPSLLPGRRDYHFPVTSNAASLLPVPCSTMHRSSKKPDKNIERKKFKKRTAMQFIQHN
jgi:hypothetical protein